VCFNWSGNTCNWNAQIQVVACIDYYLYNLPNTPVCSLRYCGQN
jgi:Notch-like protein